MPEQNITTETKTIIESPPQKNRETILYPGFRDANLNSIQSQITEQNTNAQAEIARQNLQGTRHGTGWTAVPIPKKIEYPTITGEGKVSQKNITTQFSEKIDRISRNFSKYIDKKDQGHWNMLDRIPSLEGKTGYMDKHNLKGGIWDIARESFVGSGIPKTQKDVERNNERLRRDHQKQSEFESGLRDKSGKKV